MNDEFLKVRMKGERYRRLKTRAAEAGKQISTFAREVLEHEESDLCQANELAELKSQVQALVALVQAQRQTAPPDDTEVRAALHEVRLYVREIAVDRNAQIPARVAAQLKSQSNPDIERKKS